MADNDRAFRDWGRDRRTLAVIAQQLDNIARQSLNTAKKNLIKDFLEDNITIEIKGGPDAPRISGTMDNVNITGVNLFSFIGFTAGTDPTLPILQLFEDININKAIREKRLNSRTGLIEYEVKIPTADEIFAVTPLPWADGRSWAKGIEQGISGLGWTIAAQRFPNQSRSGAAFQRTRKRIRKGKFQNVKYISALLKKHQDNFTLRL